MKKRSTILASAVLAGFAGHVASANAATVVEYFNDYGSAAGNISGLGSAGGGWNGGWTGTTTAGFPQYAPGTSLALTSPNYSNLGNQTGTDDGALQTGGTGGAANGAYRSLATPMTGTVWISALARFGNAAPDIMLVLDATSGVTNYVGIRNESSTAQARIQTSGVADQDEFGAGADITYPVNNTVLLLTRIQIDASSANDQIDYWIFDANDSTATIPAVPASVAGLPSVPSFSKTGDFFGPSLTAIGVTLAKAGSQVDAIRISNDADGFAKVTSVPEPAFIGLGAIALSVAGMRRRRAQCA